MKIVQINNVYNFGSTGKITRDLHHGLLEKGYNSVVYYGRRFKTSDVYVHKICSEFYGKFQNGLSQITGIQYGGCYLSTKRLINDIKKEKPDIVHLQCLNGHFVNIYLLLNFLKENHIPTVLTLHAEFMYTGGCSHAFECNQWSDSEGCGKVNCPQYGKELKSLLGDKTAVMWRKMKLAFEGFDKLIVVSVSPWLMERAKRSKILCDKAHAVILNGVKTSIFHSFSNSELTIFKEELGISSTERVIFHASPSFDNNPYNIKGGHFVLKLAERMQNIKFLVAGRYDQSITIPENVKLLGNIIDQTQMAKLYALANVTLLTSKRETFSMVCAESLCCGTPVVGFKAGAPEMISIPQYSDFCEYGDLDTLERTIYNWLNKDKVLSISKEAIEIYKMSHMVEEYIKIYNEVVR